MRAWDRSAGGLFISQRLALQNSRLLNNVLRAVSPLADRPRDVVAATPLGPVAAFSARPCSSGYGVADVLLQALGGWFAFGLHDFLSSKTLIQTGLATAAPETARIGRELAASTPQEPTARGGAPIFRYGSGSLDVLHALLEHRLTPFRLLVGHSKGALQINNAIQSLPAERTQGLRVVTLGCPIGENVAGVDYHQYLGLFDALGQLNAWGHWPDHWPPTWHSTNPVLPPAMAAGKITSESAHD